VKVHVFFAWYDFWIGWYYDRAGTLYICPLPMICLMISWAKKPLRTEMQDFVEMMNSFSHSQSHREAFRAWRQKRLMEEALLRNRLSQFNDPEKKEAQP